MPPHNRWRTGLALLIAGALLAFLDSGGSIFEADHAAAHAGHPQKKLFNGRWYQAGVDLTTSQINNPNVLVCDNNYASCSPKWSGAIENAVNDWNTQPDTARFLVQPDFNFFYNINIVVVDEIIEPGILGIAQFYGSNRNATCNPNACTYRYGEAYAADDGHFGVYGTLEAKQATIAHELGHLLSLRHESTNESGSPPYPLYECGFDNTGPIPVSVMAYDCINPPSAGGSGIYTVQPWDVCGINHAYPDAVYEWEGCVCYPPPAGGVLPAAPPAYFHPIAPARILDTRPAPYGPIGGPAGKLGHGCVESVQVTDVGGVPPVSAGVSAVVVNVTATQPTLASHLTIYPSGTSLPNAANLNFVAGQTVPNLVTVRVGTDGNVNIFNNSGQTHLIFDVVGWFGGPSSGSLYNPITPKRILDTRGAPYGPIGFNENGAAIPASQLGHGGILTVDVTNTYGSGVPNSDPTAVVINVTVTGPSAPSHLTVYPSDAAAPPNAANLNFVPGQTVPNLVAVKVGPAGGGSVKVRNNSGSTHVIFDIVGWYGGSGGDVFNPLAPARIMDTRFGQGWGGALGNGGIAGVDVTNTYGSGVPDPPGASAVIVNTTVTQPTAPSHLTIYPSDAALPNAANLNFVAGQTVPNLVIVKVGADGKVNVRNNSGSTHAIFDVAGYFGPPPP